MKNTDPRTGSRFLSSYLMFIIFAFSSLLMVKCNNNAASSIGNGIDSTGLKAKKLDTNAILTPDSAGKNDTANKVAAPPIDTFGPKKK